MMPLFGVVYNLMINSTFSCPAHVGIVSTTGLLAIRIRTPAPHHLTIDLKKLWSMIQDPWSGRTGDIDPEWHTSLSWLSFPDRSSSISPTPVCPFSWAWPLVIRLSMYDLARVWSWFIRSSSLVICACIQCTVRNIRRTHMRCCMSMSSYNLPGCPCPRYVHIYTDRVTYISYALQMMRPRKRSIFLYVLLITGNYIMQTWKTR